MAAARRDYTFHGAVPWQEPWLLDHNLAHALAGRGRVLYVEPPVSPLTPFRHRSVERRRTALQHLRRRHPVDVGGLHAFRPLALPPMEHPLARSISAPFVRAQLRRAAREVGIDHPVAIASMRSTRELRGTLGESLLVYLVTDWIGDSGALVGGDPARMRAGLEAMCSAADLICVSSPQLRGRLAVLGFEAQVLPHGFHADLAPRYDTSPPPPEYSSLPRPLIGYAGTIDARLDFDGLAAIAARFATGSLVLVGPRSPRLDDAALTALARRPNVHLLGLRSRDELPAYLRHLDCCLMPYREDEWARHGLPLKLWDYLYAGPPIVGSGYQSLREYPPPLVRFSSAGVELADAVSAAIDAGREGSDERRAFALANSWDARAQRLEELIDERIRAATGTDDPRPAPRANGGPESWAKASST